MIQHVSCSTSADDIHEHLKRDGCVVIDDILKPEMLDQIKNEIAPYMADADVAKCPDATPVLSGHLVCAVKGDGQGFRISGFATGCARHL